jgi:hypothetical protein
VCVPSPRSLPTRAVCGSPSPSHVLLWCSVAPAREPARAPAREAHQRSMGGDMPCLPSSGASALVSRNRGGGVPRPRPRHAPGPVDYVRNARSGPAVDYWAQRQRSHCQPSMRMGGGGVGPVRGSPTVRRRCPTHQLRALTEAGCRRPALRRSRAHACVFVCVCDCMHVCACGRVRARMLTVIAHKHDDAGHSRPVSRLSRVRNYAAVCVCARKCGSHSAQNVCM